MKGGRSSLNESGELRFRVNPRSEAGSYLLTLEQSSRAEAANMLLNNGLSVAKEVQRVSGEVAAMNGAVAALTTLLASNLSAMASKLDAIGDRLQQPSSVPGGQVQPSIAALGTSQPATSSVSAQADQRLTAAPVANPILVAAKAAALKYGSKK